MNLNIINSLENVKKCRQKNWCDIRNQRMTKLIFKACAETLQYFIWFCFYFLLLNFITIWYHLKMELYWFGSQKSRIILSIYSNSSDKIRIRDIRNWFVCFRQSGWIRRNRSHCIRNSIVGSFVRSFVHWLVRISISKCAISFVKRHYLC